MCGIIGFIGGEAAEPLLLSALERMEYRGYDSAGIATVNKQHLQLTRVQGKVERLRTKAPGSASTIGIGHTRWATHGAPSERNAHPHVAEGIAIVHNGIVENHQELRQELEKQGVSFRSDTDSEVLAWLIERNYDGKSLQQAVQKALNDVEGAFGLVVMAEDRPEQLVVARRSSPILIGKGAKGIFVASDASALAGYADEVVYLADDELAVCTAGDFRVLSIGGARRFRTPTKLDIPLESIQKGGYEHFLLKEIMEQPEAVRAALRGRLDNTKQTARLGGLNMTDKELKAIEHIFITGCGTAYYAGLLAKYVIERMTGIPVSVEVASEFRYRGAALPKGSVGLAISQSGETADTLAAVRELQKRGVPMLGVVNVVGSTIAREVDGGIYLHAGPEISVASTKAFTTQVLACVLFGLKVARLKGLKRSEGQEIVQALEGLPQELVASLELAPTIKRRASEWARFDHAFYLGRDVLYPIARESSHKLKEISYIHAEAYAAGEMKHGANALIDDKLLTVFLLGKGPLLEKSLSNLAEVRARDGRVVVVTDAPDYAKQDEDALYVATASAWTAPLVLNVALQLIAYYVAAERKCEIDQPRNLAKSVTVE